MNHPSPALSERAFAEKLALEEAITSLLSTLVPILMWLGCRLPRSLVSPCKIGRVLCVNLVIPEINSQRFLVPEAIVMVLPHGRSITPPTSKVLSSVQITCSTARRMEPFRQRLRPLSRLLHRTLIPWLPQSQHNMRHSCKHKHSCQRTHHRNRNCQHPHHCKHNSQHPHHHKSKIQAREFPRSCRLDRGERWSVFRVPSLKPR
mmetsp:Transcript_48074/g.121007  ORF Transcript_48074/g.121007 Transcript_48074/m.121007 type:complete len:204 (-) Transcript_48074:502-1113(-)